MGELVARGDGKNFIVGVRGPI